MITLKDKIALSELKLKNKTEIMKRKLMRFNSVVKNKIISPAFLLSIAIIGFNLSRRNSQKKMGASYKNHSDTTRENLVKFLNFSFLLYRMLSPKKVTNK